MKRTPTNTTTSARGAFFSMELALTLPILGTVLFALFEFSMLFFARGAIVDAARIGARKATTTGATVEDVRNEVRRILEPRLRRRLNVNVELGEHSGDVVRVSVAVPMKNAAPDLLWPIGYSLQRRRLYAETRMIKE